MLVNTLSNVNKLHLIVKLLPIFSFASQVDFYYFNIFQWEFIYIYKSLNKFKFIEKIFIPFYSLPVK